MVAEWFRRMFNLKVESLDTAAPSTDAEPPSDTKPSLEEMLAEWYRRTAPVDTAAPPTESSAEAEPLPVSDTKPSLEEMLAERLAPTVVWVEPLEAAPS